MCWCRWCLWWLVWGVRARLQAQSCDESGAAEGMPEEEEGGRKNMAVRVF